MGSYHDEHRRRSLMGPLTGFAKSIGEAVAHRHADRDAAARHAQRFGPNAQDIAAISFWRSFGFFVLGILLMGGGVHIVEARVLGALSMIGVLLAVAGLPMILAGGFNMLLFCAEKIFSAGVVTLRHRYTKTLFFSALAFGCLAVFVTIPSALMALYTLPFAFWFIRKAVKAHRE
ncbi:MAG: hypothetical protein ACK4PK_06340 [Alphaproteobacteria bacterium]